MSRSPPHQIRTVRQLVDAVGGTSAARAICRGRISANAVTNWRAVDALPWEAKFHLYRYAVANGLDVDPMLWERDHAEAVRTMKAKAAAQ